MIPPEKAAAVARGLREAFGVTEFEDISKVTGGHTSSLVFRVVVRGCPYLLKLILRAEDPARHYSSMKAAAEAGIAPRVWYTSTDDRISITDFVTDKELSVPEALLRLPRLLRTLHALPPFERAPFNTSCTFLLSQGSINSGYPQQFRASNHLRSSDCEEFFTRYDEIAAIYPYDDAEMVSSHNDVFKPDNILFDGERVWLVDWEAAYLNDRYADLAVVANHVVTNEQQEMVYLREYFGAAPDEYQSARFYLMQQLGHLFYTMSFLTLGSGGKPIDWSAGVPDFSEIHSRMWAREVDLVDKNVKVAYGRAHWERLLRNVRQPRYGEALRIVRERGARSAR